MTPEEHAKALEMLAELRRRLPVDGAGGDQIIIDACEAGAAALRQQGCGSCVECEQLVRIYFDIAANALGADEVRRLRDIQISDEIGTK